MKQSLFAATMRVSVQVADVTRAPVSTWRRCDFVFLGQSCTREQGHAGEHITIHAALEHP